MVSFLYNRICGWILFGFGIAGLLSLRIQDYLHFSVQENVANLAFGIIAMAGARARARQATLTACAVGVLLFVWGIYGFVSPLAFFGSVEPIDNAFRVAAGAFGMYAAVQDILEWRSQP